MEQFTFEDNYFNIYCPELDTYEAFESVIDKACVAVKSYDKKKHHYFFILNFIDSNNDEVDFWDLLLEHPKNYPLGQKYLQTCINRLESFKFLYEDDESPLGGFAAYQMAMTDKSFLPYFAQLLGCWDMDHEVNEAEYIEAIIGKYRWCKEVGDIIIARSSEGAGQHGFEQLQELEDFIRKHNNPLEESDFFKDLVKAVIDKYGDSIWVDLKEDADYIFGGMASEAITVREKLD